MKVIGLIGGISWRSSSEYYRVLNETVRERLGGLHSAACILYSFDHGQISALQGQGKWDELTQLMVRAARKLEGSGAQLLVICTNTIHKLADDIQSSIGIPMLHVVDATADEVLKKGLKRVGLLGTKVTMEEDFYKGRLRERYGFEVTVPDKDEQEIVHRVIFHELCHGVVEQSSRHRFKGIIQKLAAEGAEGVILGCTEIPLLVEEGDVDIPLFDTATIHAKSAVEFALR